MLIKNTCIDVLQHLDHVTYSHVVSSFQNIFVNVCSQKSHEKIFSLPCRLSLNICTHSPMPCLYHSNGFVQFEIMNKPV